MGTQRGAAPEYSEFKSLVSANPVQTTLSLSFSSDELIEVVRREIAVADQHEPHFRTILPEYRHSSQQSGNVLVWITTTNSKQIGAMDSVSFQDSINDVLIFHSLKPLAGSQVNDPNPLFPDPKVTPQPPVLQSGNPQLCGRPVLPLAVARHA